MICSFEDLVLLTSAPPETSSQLKYMIDMLFMEKFC